MLINKIVNPILLLVLCLFQSSTNAQDILSENFDFEHNTCIEKSINAKENVTVGKFGTNNSNGIKISYVGNELGSTRTVFQCHLPKNDEYTLIYSVMFDSDFQFLGGKLHGIGPDKIASGGHGIEPDSWSARVVFEKNRGIGIYLYNQNQDGRFGTEMKASNFRFEPNKYYQIKLYVKVNSASDIDNGRVMLFVDGKKLIEKNNIRFRGVNGSEGLISKFLFSTFHGGSNSSFAPRDENGSFTTVHAYFDNFRIE